MEWVQGLWQVSTPFHLLQVAPGSPAMSALEHPPAVPLSYYGIDCTSRPSFLCTQMPKLYLSCSQPLPQNIFPLRLSACTLPSPDFQGALSLAQKPSLPPPRDHEPPSLSYCTCFSIRPGLQGYLLRQQALGQEQPALMVLPPGAWMRGVFVTWAQRTSTEDRKSTRLNSSHT